MKKIKLGFLTMLGNEENHSQMMNGAIEAAQEERVEIIRFAAWAYNQDYERENEEIQHLLNVIEAQQLDGLMYLGWMPGITGRFLPGFIDRFRHLPLISLGGICPYVPNVYADARKIVRELVDHLIDEHGYKNIVFIPPFFPDERLYVFADYMKERSLFNAELMVYDEDLLLISFPDRPRRAMEIVLDERKQEIDAIIVMYDLDAISLTEELKRRKLRVPDDIAVVSAEDSIAARFFLPPLTTITFPWRDVAYVGCKKLVRAVKKEKIEHSTTVFGHLIIRNSCGCRLHYASRAKLEESLLKTFHRADEKVDVKKLCLLADEIEKEQAGHGLDIKILMEKMADDLTQGTTTLFVEEFERQIQTRIIRGPRREMIGSIENIFWHLRKTILAYFTADKEMLILLQEILLKTAVLICEASIFCVGYDNQERKVLNDELHLLGQLMSTTFGLDKMMHSLEKNLYKIQLPSCYIFVREEEKKGGTYRRFLLKFKYTDGARRSDEDEKISEGHIAEAVGCSHDVLLCQMLHIDSEFFGFIVFEPSGRDYRTYETLTLHISSALKNAFLLDQLAQESELRMKKELQLAHYANYDYLSNLLNRRSFNKVTQHMIDMAEHADRQERFYIFFFDFDDFKKVNDQYGHDAGDQLIVKISQAIREQLASSAYHVPRDLIDRPDDALHEAIFRVGGDEFTAIIKASDEKQIQDLAASVIQTVSRPYVVDGKKIVITCSLGVSVYPNDATHADDLVARADEAMYRAKKTKGMFVFYSDIK